MRLFFIALFNLLSMLPTMAQHFHLKVDLKNEFGQPVNGAYVTADDQKLVADEESTGHYVFSNLVSGRHQLKITYQGYKTVERTLELEDRDIQIEVRLQMDTEELGEVVGV